MSHRLHGWRPPERNQWRTGQRGGRTRPTRSTVAQREDEKKAADSGQHGLGGRGREERRGREGRRERKGGRWGRREAGREREREGERGKEREGEREGERGRERGREREGEEGRVLIFISWIVSKYLLH